MPVNNSESSQDIYSSNLKEKLSEVEKESKDNISKINSVMAGIVIFIVVTFIIEICQMNNDRIKDKEIYIQYTQMYKDYFEESSKMKEVINEQKININNLENKINLLKAKNPYLK